MAQFSYPTNAEISLIEQEKMPRLMEGRVLFDFFRITSKDASIVTWEQRDNYTGLQSVRGIGGQPSRVKAIGGKRYSVEPGIYGEFRSLDEIELMHRRAWGTANQIIKLDDLVMEASEFLQQRFLDRVEMVGWSAMFGSFQILGPNGIVLHQDAFNNQSYAATVSWILPGTSGPIGDFRNIQLLSRGKSTSFGSDAKAYMNRKTFNWLIANTNNADLYGKRTSGLANVMTLDQVNAVLAGEGLPLIVIYDQGYLTDATTSVASQFVPYIPDNKVVVIGTRPGNASVGEYIMVRNVNNPGLAEGQYTKVIDRGEYEVPRSIEVHNGHNGAPALYYPGSVVIMSV